MRLKVTKHAPFDLNPLSGNPKAAAVFKEAADILTPKQFWIGTGTMLGLWRAGAFIPYDTDFDFWLIGDKDHPAVPALPSQFRLVRSIDLGPLPMQRAYEKDGVIVDLAFFWRGIDPKYVIHQHDVGAFRMEERLVEPTKYAHYGDAHVLIPNDPEAYLEWWYGPTWRVPSNSKGPAFLDSVCMERT